MNSTLLLQYIRKRYLYLKSMERLSLRLKSKNIEWHSTQQTANASLIPWAHRTSVFMMKVFGWLHTTNQVVIIPLLCCLSRTLTLLSNWFQLTFQFRQKIKIFIKNESSLNSIVTMISINELNWILLKDTNNWVYCQFYKITKKSICFTTYSIQWRNQIK